MHTHLRSDFTYRCLLFDNELAAPFITPETANNALIQVNDTDFDYKTMEIPTNDQVVTTTSTIGK